jgi:hypothetical protein
MGLARGASRRRVAVSLAIAAIAAGAGCGSSSPSADVVTGKSTCGDLEAILPAARDEAARRATDLYAAENGVDRSQLNDLESACKFDPSLTVGQALTGSGDGTQPAEAPAAPKFEPTRTYRWSVESADGSTGEVRFQLGDVEGVSDELPAGFADLTSACELDEQRDVVVPLKATFENTTAGFDMSPSVNWRVEEAGDNVGAIGLEAASVFSDGPSCDALNSGSIDDGAGVSFDAIAPDATADHDWLLVVHDYLSPTNPSGEAEALDSYFAVVTGQVENSSFETTCFEAPADLYAFTGGFLALAGALSPAFPLSGDSPVDRSEESGDEPPMCDAVDERNEPAPGSDESLPPEEYKIYEE